MVLSGVKDVVSYLQCRIQHPHSRTALSARVARRSRLNGNLTITPNSTTSESILENGVYPTGEPKRTKVLITQARIDQFIEWARERSRGCEIKPQEGR